MPVAALALALVVLPGCERRSDAERYHHALVEARSYATARASCRRIEDPDSRGDCLVGVMEVWQRLDAAGCHEILAPAGAGAGAAPELAVWRDECMFQLAERQRAHGDLPTALRTCLDSRWARECSWHLLQDEAEASLDEPAAVAEARIRAFRDAPRLPDASLQFWIIRARAGAARGRPVSEADCAALAAPAPCREALGVTVRSMLDARLRAEGTSGCAHVVQTAATLSGVAWLPGPLVDAEVARWASARCPTSGAERSGPP
ncbi:hypothetical protein L6R53_02815 [Myxococcota bacterium]|nr:hypothetical protein [Myxococcota bacterium]